MGMVNRQYVASFVMAMLALCGCTATRVQPPVQLSALLEVERMVLMPIADAREDGERFESVAVGRHVRKAAHKLLAKKGYAVLSRELFAKAEANSAQVVSHGLEAGSAAELAALAPEGVTTLLFIVVKEVSQHYDGGGDAYRIVLSGIVVDKASESIIWRSSGVGTSNFGGLFRAVTPLQGQYDAVYEALTEMFAAVPNRKA